MPSTRRPSRSRPAGRLAAHHVPRSRRPALLGRHLFSAGAALGPPGLSPGAAAHCRDLSPRSRAAWPRTSPRSRRRWAACRAAPAARSGRDLDASRSAFCRQSITVHGGIGGAPKFPQAPIFELLWRDGMRSGDRRCRDAVHITLRAHVAGRHLRSSGRRLRPLLHRCPMARAAFREDALRQCALLDLLALACRTLRDPLYEARIRETVGWVLREMRTGGAKRGDRLTRSMPIAKASRASSTSGPRTRSTRCWVPMRRFQAAL